MEKLKRKLVENRINLDEDFYELSKKYILLLLEYNKIHNITGAKTADKIIENIYDSIFPLPYIQNPKTILDIGTGAGFPAIILAFALPNVKIYLVEPNRKRVAFLTLAKVSLKLKNITIIPKRVEQIEGLEIDLITSRAVTEMELLFKISKKIISKNTKFLFYKGSNLENEMKMSGDFEYEIIKRDFRNYIFIRQFNG